MTTKVCQEALRELDRTRSNVNRWWRLLYAFGVAVTIFSILLVAALIWGNAPAQYLSGLATIVSGGGVAFVTRNKDAAVAEHQEAKAALTPACGSQRGVAESAGVVPEEILKILSE